MSDNKPNTHQNGKGDKPRPINLKKYRENYDSINWGAKKISEVKPTEAMIQLWNSEHETGPAYFGSGYIRQKK